MITALVMLTVWASPAEVPLIVREEGARQQVTGFLNQCTSTSDAMQCLGDLTFHCEASDFSDGAQHYICRARLAIQTTRISDEVAPPSASDLFDFVVKVSQSGEGWSSEVLSIELVQE